MTHRQFKLTEADLHAHLRRRMEQRGITLSELEQVLSKGREAVSAKPGTYGKVLVISFGAEWEGQFYQEKELTVYYKLTDSDELILLTVIARYGQGF